MAFDLKDEEQVKEYLEKLGIEYRFQCFYEKSPEGCHRLAEFLDTIRKEPERAVPVFKSNCDDNGYGQSCFKYANHRLFGDGCEKDVDEALEYHKKGCDKRYVSSCFNAGMMHLAKERFDMEKALAYLDSACEANHAGSCYELSGLYIAGRPPGLRKDMARAFHYSQKACDMGHVYSCANLSIMYRKGEGVDKNELFAKKYRKRAKELEHELTKEQITLTFNQ